MGKLYVVATPIGNLGDISPNMRHALAEADLIAAEDTRVTQKLLSHIGLSKPLISCHRHNEASRVPELVRRMLEDDIIIALVTDAGTPGVSDPGELLVDASASAGIRVEPVCGPSAVAAALSISGFLSEGYVFYGFLPREEGPRRRALERMVHGPAVAVLFESPHRVKQLMHSIEAVLPQARLCLCCDLTKKFECVLRGAPDYVARALENNPNAQKGEYVLVMDMSACPSTEPNAAPDPAATVLSALLEGMGEKQAVVYAVGKGVPRNLAYQAMLKIKAWKEG